MEQLQIKHLFPRNLFEHFDMDGQSNFLENVSITSDPKRLKLLDSNTPNYDSLRVKCHGKQWLIDQILIASDVELNCYYIFLDQSY